MNIQTYILPDWKTTIEKQDMDDDLKHRFIAIGESMAEYLDRYMMRNMPSDWYEGWTRYQFPLQIHDLVLDLHKVFADHFAEYIEKYRAGIKGEFIIAKGEINKIRLLEKRYEKFLTEKEAQLDEIRSEIRSLRKTREKKSSRPKNKKPTRVQKPVQEEKFAESDEQSAKSSSGVLDHDYVYKRWMEMVESKPISKSYWHIHEYMSRYILEYAKENTEDGEITKQVIDDFYAEYSKGKRPKTLNHYNRVVYRFWDFYKTLVSEEDEMKVW